MEINFRKDIDWFVKNIESRKRLLPTFVHAAARLTQQVNSDFDKFIENHGYDIVYDEEGDITEFAVPDEYSRRYGLLSRTYQHSLIFTDLLPKMTLVSLVSLFDAYLARLVKTLFEEKPEILNGSTKQLTFSEINDFENIEDAREHIINLEVESLLRDSHIEQFKWLEGKIGITLRKDLTIWKNFIELTERRNLFVHADGIVNKQYFTACKNAGYQLDKSLSIGDRLDVDPDYYESACACIAEIGMKLGQVMWRKLLPGELNEADGSLIDAVYDFLSSKDYSLALVMSEFSEIPAIKNHCLENTYYLKINHVIALKGLDRDDECLKILDTIDWSALSDKFKIAASALRDDWEETEKLMVKIGDSGDIDKSQYQSWPLFRWFRKTDSFKNTYKKVFGEEYKIVATTIQEDEPSDNDDNNS